MPRLCKPHTSVKRTVSLHPQLDEVVRKVQATMIVNGRKAHYSLALNTVLVAYFFDVARFRNQNHRELELVRSVKGFLEGSPISEEDMEKFNVTLKEISRRYKPVTHL